MHSFHILIPVQGFGIISQFGIFMTIAPVDVIDNTLQAIEMQISGSNAGSLPTNVLR